MNIQMKPIRTVVVDNDLSFLYELQRTLRDEPDIEIVEECTSGREALHCIREKQPDLLFLDIQLSDDINFNVLQSIDNTILPYIVITASHSQDALQAFDLFAIDYVLKPYDRDRLDRTLERVRKLIHRTDAIDTAIPSNLHDTSAVKPSYPERFMVKLHDKIIFIKIHDVDWIESAGNYVRLHIGKDQYLLRDTMNNIERKLDPENFIRIHRTSIVNIDRIQELQNWFNGDYCSPERENDLDHTTDVGFRAILN